MRTLRTLIAIVLVVIACFAIASFITTSETVDQYPIYYNNLIYKYAKENDLDPFLVAAIIRTESNYDPEVSSHANAHGLMQLLPETLEWISMRRGEAFEPNQIKDPEANIRAGTYYVRYLLDEFQDVSLMLAAYNGGPANVAKWLTIKEYSKDGKQLDFIPFEETRNYVEKVTKYRDEYTKVYHGVFPESEKDHNNEVSFHATVYKNFLLLLRRKY